jgi:hypothetical protein
MDIADKAKNTKEMPIVHFVGYHDYLLAKVMQPYQSFLQVM